MKNLFSSKYEVCSINVETEAVFTKTRMNNKWNNDIPQNTSYVQKVIEIEAVFTKTEMNSEWNVNFLQNTRCVEKLSKLKLYLPRKKWTINEKFIFFKIRGVFNKCRNWSCIYQNRNVQWMKR